MSNQSTERGLPCNLDAERYVLGSILLDGTQFETMAGSLAADAFSLEKHRRIWRRMADLHGRGESIDRVTLANELKRHFELESVDGLGYLVSLDDGLPQIYNLDSYVRIIQEKSRIIPCALRSGTSCVIERILVKHSPQAIWNASIGGFVLPVSSAVTRMSSGNLRPQ